MTLAETQKLSGVAESVGDSIASLTASSLATDWNCWSQLGVQACFYHVVWAITLTKFLNFHWAFWAFGNVFRKSKSFSIWGPRKSFFLDFVLAYTIKFVFCLLRTFDLHQVTVFSGLLLLTGHF